MTEPMSVRIEVWPLAADDAGIWLISGGDAWRPALPVLSDSEPHVDVERELAVHEVRSDAVLVHSTSWRVDATHVILTYVAVIDGDGSVRDRWPGALRVSAGLVYAADDPPAASPLDAPTPRSIDVLLHAIRHLRFLLDTDDAVRPALAGDWRRHLAHLQPALAGWYRGGS
jgi:hypothetical protein